MISRHHYLARELVKLGHRVTIVGARQHHLLREDVDAKALPAEEEVDGYRFIRLGVPAYAHAHDKRRILAWFAFAAKLIGLRRRLGMKPDVVLYSSPDPIGYLGAERLAQACGARLIFEVRDIWPLTLIEIGGYRPQHIFIRLLEWIERRAYANADSVISNLEGAVEHMVSQGMSRAKFTWISNGLTLDEAAKPSPLAPEIADQIPDQGFRVVYTGTLGAANALDTLIDAAALLRELPDVTILLVGQGRARAGLEARCAQLELKNVRFLGLVPKAQIQSVLAACDACVISTLDSPLYRFGTSPNKVFDYLYSGRPVISLYSGNYDLVSKYNAGIQVPAENPTACAEAIKILRNMSSQERSLLGLNGRQSILKHLNYERLGGELERVLVSPAR